MSAERGSSFGLLLRRSRRAAGLTQEALAERAHLSAYTISALERGANLTPRKDTLALLAEALGLMLVERAALEAAAHGHGAGPQASSTAFGVVAPLVGRARELALLERHLAGEGPPVLLLAGEPGIGKTRLLAEVAQRAMDQGWCVLDGGCQRRGDQEPYAPLPYALDAYLQGRTPAQRRADLRGCAWLVRLLPELATMGIEALPGWTLSPAQERRLIFKAVERFVANVAGPVGTLLLLDDLQWAGRDALDLVATLARSTTARHLRLVGAYRDTEVQSDDPLSVTLADLAQARQARHWTLAPLS